MMEGCAAAGNTHHQELWAGVLGVVLEDAKAQEEWDPVAALVTAGAERGALCLYTTVYQDPTGAGAAALLDRGAFIDPEDVLGCTPPLHRQSMITQLLLQKGADAEKPGSGGTTPAFMAASHGFAAAVRVEPWSR